VRCGPREDDPSRRHCGRGDDQIMRAALLATAVNMCKKPSMRLGSRHVIKLDGQSFEYSDEKLTARGAMSGPRELNPGTQHGNRNRSDD
jgi:hypothetical protein